MEERQSITIKEIFNGEDFSIGDLIIIFKSTLIAQKKYLLICFTFFLIASVLHFYSKEVEYESEATVLIDQNVSPQGGGALAGLLGISGTNSALLSDNIFGPEMYEEIVKSDAFLNELAETKFLQDENSGKTETLAEYFKKYNKKRYWEKTYLATKFRTSNTTKLNNNNRFSNSDSFWKMSIDFNDSAKSLYFTNKVPPIVEIPAEITNAAGNLKQRIKIEIKGKRLKVHIKMPDEKLGANLCKLVLEKIINYVYIYKTNRQRENIYYLEKNFIAAKAKYSNAQLALANYKDQNIGLIFQSAQTREQILNNELSLAFNLYNQFSVQLEQAKFDYKKEQPLFIVTDPIKFLGINNNNYSIMFLKYFLIFILFSLALVFYRIINPKL